MRASRREAMRTSSGVGGHCRVYRSLPPLAHLPRASREEQHRVLVLGSTDHDQNHNHNDDHNHSQSCTY